MRGSQCRLAGSQGPTCWESKLERKKCKAVTRAGVVLDVEMLLGKPEEEKGQGFAYVASSELDPLLGCPDFTKGPAFFMGWNIRIYKLL